LLRDPGLDVLKAIATLLVIAGHVIQFTNMDFDKSILFKMIYSFHMPLFMCISGYLMPDKVGPGFFRRKFFQLIIPFFLWSAMLIVVRNIIQGSEISLQILGEGLLQVLLTPENGLWFLWVLFLNCALFALLEGRYRLQISFAIIGFLYLIQFVKGEFGWFGLNLVRWHYFFFIFGFLIRSNRILHVANRFLWVLVPLTILALTQWDRNLISGFLGGALTSPFFAKILTLVVKYVAALGVLVLLFLIKGRLGFSGSVISFLANHSLGYYGTQAVFLIPATLIWKSQNGLDQFALFTLTVIVCSVVVLIFDRFDFTRRLFLGRAQASPSFPKSQ